MNKLLIHACCAPCLVEVYDVLLKEQQSLNISEMDIIWYNKNIHPKVEYDKRKKAYIEYVKSLDKTPYLIDEYDLMSFTKIASSIEDTEYTSRCDYCYISRLEKVFIYAKENGYTHVTTTLLISPYQNHDLIISVLLRLEKKYNIKFLYKDFRPLFREGQRKSRELGLYMQKYCGCIYSIDEGRWQGI
ncbi:MAG: epoxyqueuosine reductase QueH [Clostridia bacterium]|nr:epoxyqueuosine reductase QueH [Clostridia bacterium]MDD4375782.1 epoxyqueuosine reductase QueH [Clostridia bacterium]